MSPFRTALTALALAAGAGLVILPQYLVAQPAPQTSEPGPATGGTVPDRAAVESIVRDYLLNNPEILREMADRLKAKDDALAQAERADVFKTSSAEIYDSEHQVVLGNPKGDVTLVEFFDYNCGYCRQALPDTEALLKSDPNLRIVLKEFPVLGQGSVDAARVAVVVAAQAPGKYFEFHRRLLGGDGADGPTAISVAKEVGVDIDKLSTELADPRVEAALVSVHTLARKLGINGTPTYVIADQVLPGAVGLENLQEIIGNVRKCGKAACS